MYEYMYEVERKRALLPALFKMCGPKLEELDLNVNLLHSEVDSIQKHCRNLRRLKFGGLLQPTMKGIWRDLGNCVRELEMVVYPERFEFMRKKWKGNYPGVSTLSLCFLDGITDGDGVVDIWSKFGSNLKVLNLYVESLSADDFR